jgi:hypothetical protein
MRRKSCENSVKLLKTPSHLPASDELRDNLIFLPSERVQARAAVEVVDEDGDLERIEAVFRARGHGIDACFAQDG